MTQPATEDLQEVLNRREAQRREYGQFVCGPSPIDVGMSRAFNPGDPVPASTVARFGWQEQGLVVKADSAEAEEITAARTIERPAGNASKDEWIGYAVSVGTPVEDVEDMTRDEIRDRFNSEG